MRNTTTRAATYNAGLSRAGKPGHRSPYGYNSLGFILHAKSGAEEVI